VKFISWWNLQIIQTGCKIHILQLSNSSRKHIRHQAQEPEGGEAELWEALEEEAEEDEGSE
jgi:hypothetical protein